MRKTTTSVLVAGGGLSGLSAAVFLVWHGVPCVLVERHADVLSHPRARGINPRSMELFRTVGLQDTIEAVNPHSGEISSWTSWLQLRAVTLAGEEIERAEITAGQRRDHLHSPVGWAPIDQDKLERVLRAHAVSTGADVRFGTELVSLEQDGSGVTATVRKRSDRVAEQIEAQYVIAADGYHGALREKLGIGVTGPGPLSSQASFMFDADLSPALRGRKVTLCYLDNPAKGTVLMPYDGLSRWTLSVPYPAESRVPVSDLDSEWCLAATRSATGLPDLTIDVVPQLPGSDTKVLAFDLAGAVAERLRAARVFLVGDTAHAIPPMGAYGASTGIQDAHNLAWKLACVLSGRAGVGLLDTYETERLPVAKLTLEQAMGYMSHRTGRQVGGHDRRSGPSHEDVIFGYRYPVAGALGEPGPAVLPVGELRAQPGTRAPHLPIKGPAGESSTLDFFGRDFIVLTGPDGGGWAAAASDVSTRLGVPLPAYRFGFELVEPENRWPAMYDLEPDGAVVVRPDGFVVWRSDSRTPHDADELEHALAGVLARG
jgi:putative polyketide hydroxylase